MPLMAAWLMEVGWAGNGIAAQHSKLIKV